MAAAPLGVREVLRSRALPTSGLASDVACAVLTEPPECRVALLPKLPAALDCAAECMLCCAVLLMLVVRVAAGASVVVSWVGVRVLAEELPPAGSKYAGARQRQQVSLPVSIWSWRHDGWQQGLQQTRLASPTYNANLPIGTTDVQKRVRNYVCVPIFLRRQATICHL